MTFSRGRTRADLLTGLVDQGVSSLTNLMAVLAIASSVEIDDFGAFSLTYSGLVLLLSLTRAYFGLPIALEAGRSSAVEPKAFYSGISGLAIAAPLVVLGLGLLAGFSAHSTGALVLSGGVALVTPIFLAQDLARYQLIAERRAVWALLSDISWLAVVAALWVFRSQLSIFGLALVWCMGPMLAFGIVVFVRPPRIMWGEGLRALAPKRGVREASSLTVLLSNGLTLLIGILMLPVYGVAAAGVLRAASTTFGPLNTLIAYLDTGVLAALARRSRTRDRVTVVLVGAGFSVIVLGWGAVLLWLPQTVGVFLLGQTWILAREILPITTVEYVFVGLSAAAALFLKVRGHARQLLSAKVAWALTSLAGVSIAVLVHAEFVAVPWSLALGAAVGATLQWLQVRGRSNRSPEGPPNAVVGESQP